jgi:hypothetical protein
LPAALGGESRGRSLAAGGGFTSGALQHVEEIEELLHADAAGTAGLSGVARLIGRLRRRDGTQSSR